MILFRWRNRNGTSAFESFVDNKLPCIFSAYRNQRTQLVLHDSSTDVNDTHSWCHLYCYNIRIGRCGKSRCLKHTWTHIRNVVTRCIDSLIICLQQLNDYFPLLCITQLKVPSCDRIDRMRPNSYESIPWSYITPLCDILKHFLLLFCIWKMSRLTHINI